MSGGLIHVGAWDGREYLDWPSDRKLLLFEPQAEAFDLLCANLGDRLNVDLRMLAVGAEPGTAEMHTVSPSHSSSLLEPGDPRMATGATEAVLVTTLDAALDGSEEYETLRIDTQGYELEVLRGAVETLASLKRIEVEIHDPAVYPGAAQLGEIDDFLDRHGFQRVSWDTESSDDLGDATYERR